VGYPSADTWRAAKQLVAIYPALLLVAVTNTVSGQVTRYAYDADGRRVLRTNPDGTKVAYAGDHYAVQVNTGVATSYYYFGSQRVAVRTGAMLYHLYAYQLGSASLATSGASTWSEQRYYPFGQTRWSSGTMPTDHTFTGQRVCRYSNIIEMGARWYSPVLGRFLSPDSIVPRPGDPQTFNRYAYARNSPVTRVDPSGHTDCDAGNTQCWIDQYIARANWYRQQLTFRWLSDSRLSDDVKTKVEGFYRNMLDDPASFANRYVDAVTFGRSDESTYLMLLLTETTIGAHSPEQLVHAVLEDRFGTPVANATLQARRANENQGSSAGNFAIETTKASVTVWWMGKHVLDYILKRGWTSDMIDDTIARGDTEPTTIQRHDPATNLRVNEGPGTVYYQESGHYLVLKNADGEVIQLSDLNDATWTDLTGAPVHRRP
jgi:RHS repeat-associated protein